MTAAELIKELTSQIERGMLSPEAIVYTYEAVMESGWGHQDYASLEKVKADGVESTYSAQLWEKIRNAPELTPPADTVYLI